MLLMEIGSIENSSLAILDICWSELSSEYVIRKSTNDLYCLLHSAELNWVGPIIIISPAGLIGCESLVSSHCLNQSGGILNEKSFLRLVIVFHSVLAPVSADVLLIVEVDALAGDVVTF